MHNISFSVGRSGDSLADHAHNLTLNKQQCALLAETTRLSSVGDVEKFIEDFTSMNLWDKFVDFFFHCNDKKHLLHSIALCHLSSFPQSEVYLTQYQQKIAEVDQASPVVLYYLKSECRKELFQHCSLSPLGQIILTLPVEGSETGLRIPIKLGTYSGDELWKGAPKAAEALTMLTRPVERSVLTQIKDCVAQKDRVDINNINILVNKAVSYFKSKVHDAENTEKYNMLHQGIADICQACGDNDKYTALVKNCDEALSTLETHWNSAHQDVTRPDLSPSIIAHQQQEMSTPDHKLVVDEQRIAQLTDQDFTKGGAHKKYHPGAGVLQAQDKMGAGDFVREGQLKKYAEDKPKLQSYISTQQAIVPPPHCNQSLSYATFDRYDSQHITTSSLHDCIKDLDRKQASNLLVQLMEMSKTFYLNKVSHGDLHMDNLLVHRRCDNGELFIKAIDFGHVRTGNDFSSRKMTDIEYFFERKATSVPETVHRNHLRAENNPRMSKHYPLHKIMSQLNVNARGSDIQKFLTSVGQQLKQDLHLAGDDQVAIEAAFDRALDAMQNVHLAPEKYPAKSQLLTQPGRGG